MKKESKSILIFPELSYKIVGLLFDVHNQLGGGHREKYYYKALRILFKKHKLAFKEQLNSPLNFNGNKIGDYFMDFLIENQIVLEIKTGERFKMKDINQVYSYLKSSNLKLGILANFTKGGIRFKRILNIK